MRQVRIQTTHRLLVQKPGQAGDNGTHMRFCGRHPDLGWPASCQRVHIRRHGPQLIHDQRIVVGQIRAGNIDTFRPAAAPCVLQPCQRRSKRCALLGEHRLAAQTVLQYGRGQRGTALESGRIVTAAALTPDVLCGQQEGCAVRRRVDVFRGISKPGGVEPMEAAYLRVDVLANARVGIGLSPRRA